MICQDRLGTRLKKVVREKAFLFSHRSVGAVASDANPQRVAGWIEDLVRAYRPTHAACYVTIRYEINGSPARDEEHLAKSTLQRFKNYSRRLPHRRGADRPGSYGRPVRRRAQRLVQSIV